MRFVTINEITGKVVNVGQVNNQAQLTQPPEAHRHIVEADWVVGSDPGIDDEWDGQVPTTFTSPGNELNALSISELLDKQAQGRAEAEAIDEAIRARVV